MKLSIRRTSTAPTACNSLSISSVSMWWWRFTTGMSDPPPQQERRMFVRACWKGSHIGQTRSDHTDQIRSDHQFIGQVFRGHVHPWPVWAALSFKHRTDQIRSCHTISYQTLIMWCRSVGADTSLICRICVIYVICMTRLSLSREHVSCVIGARSVWYTWVYGTTLLVGILTTTNKSSRWSISCTSWFVQPTDATHATTEVPLVFFLSSSLEELRKSTK